MDLATDVSLVNRRKRVFRLIGGQKSGEPRCGAFFVFGSPLRGAGFAGDFNIIEARLMRGAARTIHDVGHSSAHLVQRAGRKI